MTSRPKATLALIAAGLLLAGCGGGGEDDVPPASPRAADSPAVVRLLADADAAIGKGALGDAARLLDEARSLAPESPGLWVAIARLRLRGGEHLAALEAADRALAFGPDHAPALRLRALMVRDAHGAGDALRWFAAARKAAPADADILADYAATLGDAGRARAMLKTVRALAEAAPDDSRAPYLQAVLAARGGEYGLARSLLTRSGMATRGVPAALLLQAVISLQEGNTASAAATLETLAARQPANPRLRELWAHALLAGRRDDEVIARFAEDAARPEASPYLVMLVARAHERRGDRVAAAPLLARAYRAGRSAPVTLSAREGLPQPSADMRRSLAAGDRSGARAQAEALHARFPASADVGSLVGDAMAGAGDAPAALTAYGRAAEVRRPWPLTRRMIAAYTAIGNRAAADRLLARHVAGETENASALIALARQQAASGDWARAAVLLDHAIRLGAGHDPALLGLRLEAARALGETGEARRFAALLAEVRPRSLTRP
jgi:Tfp pilus assembly protein PilF